MDELSRKKVKAFQITYEKQAKEGSELALWREDAEDGALCEIRCGEDVLSQFRVWFEA